MNFSRPYVEGTWMVAAHDSSRIDSVYVVGPDERVRIIIEWIASALNAYKT